MVEHQLVDGQLTPVSYALEINTPFRVRCESAPWMGMLVARADGTLTLREHLSELKNRNLLSPESSEQEFARSVKTLIAGGFFEIEDFRMPQAAG